MERSARVCQAPGHCFFSDLDRDTSDVSPFIDTQQLTEPPCPLDSAKGRAFASTCNESSPDDAHRHIPGEGVLTLPCDTGPGPSPYLTLTDTVKHDSLGTGMSCWQSSFEECDSFPPRTPPSRDRLPSYTRRLQVDAGEFNRLMRYTINIPLCVDMTDLELHPSTFHALPMLRYYDNSRPRPPGHVFVYTDGSGGTAQLEGASFGVAILFIASGDPFSVYFLGFFWRPSRN